MTVLYAHVQTLRLDNESMFNQRLLHYQSQKLVFASLVVGPPAGEALNRGIHVL